MEEAMVEEYKKELREKMETYKKNKEEEFLKKELEMQQQLLTKENEFQVRLQNEKKLVQQQAEEALRKSIGADFENRLALMQQERNEQEEKLKTARQRELEFMQKEKALQQEKEELELQVQRKLQEERTRMAEDIRRMEQQKSEARESDLKLQMKELEKQLLDQKNLAEEMRRRAEQGSMQLQGEVQELALEEMLRAAFPFDAVDEVGKGKRGADCIQTVRNQFGQECGKIIYESKRTKHFDKSWVEKLKADMRHNAADVAVIVSQALPEEIHLFGEIGGVWICSFTEAHAMAHLLRDGIIRIYNATKTQENRGDKMHMLYDYLTSNEFAEQWKAIREGFQSMRSSIQKERDAMEKLWKAREKQLDKVLLNAVHIRGSIEGIAGQDAIDMNLLDDSAEHLLTD